MVEFAAMIGIGSIEYGPEVSRQPISKSVQALNRAFATSEDRQVVDIVFVIPGRLGKADFSGFKVRRAARNKPTVVFVEVPLDLVSESEPMAGLLDLARAALTLLPPSLSVAGRTVSYADLVAELEAAAGVLAPTGLARSQGTVSRRSRRPTDGTRQSELGGVCIRIPIRDRQMADEAFDLESAIETRIRSSGLGYVDGNEVGEGEFTIYAYGPDVARLRDAVDAVVKRRWDHPGVTLGLIEADNGDTASV